jgi:hypothetical protein
MNRPKPGCALHGKRPPGPSVEGRLILLFRLIGTPPFNLARTMPSGALESIS